MVSASRSGMRLIVATPADKSPSAVAPSIARIPNVVPLDKLCRRSTWPPLDTSRFNLPCLGVYPLNVCLMLIY